MNAVNGLSKVMICGAASMALTILSGWTFVHSTADAFYASDMPTVVILAKAEKDTRLVQTGVSGLLQ
jgi:hypothetical protein